MVKTDLHIYCFKEEISLENRSGKFQTGSCTFIREILLNLAQESNSTDILHMLRPCNLPPSTRGLLSLCGLITARNLESQSHRESM